MKKLDYSGGKKLVRDEIHKGDPKVWEISEVEVLEDDEVFLTALLDKLVEEAEEARKSEGSLEELGDIETVIDAILKLKGCTRMDLRRQQKEKDERKGKFNNRHFLSSRRKI